jgi:hypothetical protein
MNNAIRVGWANRDKIVPRGEQSSAAHRWVWDADQEIELGPNRRQSPKDEIWPLGIFNVPLERGASNWTHERRSKARRELLDSMEPRFRCCFVAWTLSFN